HKISSQKGQAASLTAQANAIQARTGRLAPYTSFVTMANQRTQTVAQLVQARFDWSHALHELGRVMPAGTALATLHGTVGPAGATASSSTTATPTAGGTPASSTPAGSVPVFTLTGCATSQAVVAQTLQRLKLMDGASEVQLQSSTQTASGSSSSSSGSGGCSDASFSAQVAFQGLPSGPAPSVSTGSSTSTAPPCPARRPARWARRCRDDYPRSAHAGGDRRARCVARRVVHDGCARARTSCEGDRRSRSGPPKGLHRRIRSRQRNEGACTVLDRLRLPGEPWTGCALLA